MDFKLPKRPEDSHKGTFGKVINVAGSRYMPGAAYLSSISALTAGCGYLILASEEEVIQAVAAQTQNVVFAPIKEIKNILKDADVLELGCGLSTSKKAVKLFKDTIKNTPDIPTVIDADGLNILSKINDIRLSEKLILTPHPKEAARLLNKNLKDILYNMEDSAKEISAKYSCVTVLKSNKSIICDKNGNITYNATGNSALAKAGSGDVLTGIIAGLLAQKMKLYEAAVLGCHLHGLCGDLAKNDLTEYGVSASDLIRYIPYSIKLMLGN